MAFALSIVREMGDPIDMTQQVPVARTQTQCRRCRCFLTSCMPPMQITNEAMPRWSCHRCRVSDGGSSGDAAELVVCSFDWSVLTVNIICLSGLYDALSSSSLVAVLNG